MKSNGILFAALISNFAFIRSYAAREPENLIGLKAEMKATMNHGFVTHVLDFPGAFLSTLSRLFAGWKTRVFDFGSGRL